MRSALTQLELGNDAVQQIGADEEGEYVIRIQDPEFGAAETRNAVESALTTQFGEDGSRRPTTPPRSARG